MPQVELDDQVFQAAQRRAADDGYASINEYIADVVVHDLSYGSENFEHSLTPAQLAELEQMSAQVKAGGATYSVPELREHFESRRKTWLADHAG